MTGAAVWVQRLQTVVPSSWNALSWQPVCCVGRVGHQEGSQLDLKRAASLAFKGSEGKGHSCTWGTRAEEE